MANQNPFLQSPFQALIDKQAEPIQLPGSDLVTDVEVPDLSAAPEQPAAQVAQPAAPVPKKAKAKPTSLIPPADLMPVFSASASHFGVPENVLMAIAQQESSYDPEAVNSESGAQGIAQYMDATAKSLGINARDPNEAIPATAMQIAERLAKGASLEDAVMEHFAGPDRKKWGDKTRAYGKSVLEKAEAIGRELYKDLPTSEPEPAVTADSSPLPNFGVAPEALKRIQAQWNAATPEERVQMEAIRGPRGYIARELNKRHPAKQPAPNPLGLEVDPMAQVNDAYKNPTLDSIDPRAEARARNLVNQGMEGDTANKVARAAALAGMTPGTEPGIGQRIENSSFDFATRKKFQEDPFFSNPAVRGAVKGYEGYKRGILGLNQMAAEVLGADNLAGSLSEAGAESREAEAAMGEAGSYGQRMFEGAVSSIAQQVPALVGGAVTGSEALVLGTMFAQTFGSEYSEGRARGQNEEQAMGRAALYGTFEVVGEKLGLGDTLRGLRGAVDGATTKDVATNMARALLKEIPGEQLTTLGQFGTDKIGGGYGLNTEAGLAEYLQQAADTAVQTVMQGGIMGGVTTGASAVGNRLAGPQRQAPQQMPQERVEPSLQPEAQSMQPAAPSMQPEQDEESWSGEVMGDDGLMRRVSNEGVSDPVAPSGPLEASVASVAAEAPEAGPLSSAVAQAAQLHDADPAPLPAMPEPEPQAPDYTAMPVEELKAQVQQLAAQDKQATDPEQRKKIRAERKTVEKEIGARAKQAQADSKPAEEPLTTGPFDDIKTANKMMMRYAEKTSAPHEVIEKDGKFRIQPLEASDGLDTAGASGRDDGRGRSGEPADGVGLSDGAGRAGAGTVPVSGNDGTTRERGSDAASNRTAADEAADPDSAVAPERNPYAAYSASKPEFAESYMDKRGVDRSKYEVQQTGPVRWQIVPRAAQQAEPKVIDAFHGTGGDFAEFSDTGLGSHFTTDASVASAFAESFKDGGNVRKVKLSIRNPLRAKDHGGSHTDAHSVAQSLVDEGHLPVDYVGDAFFERLMNGPNGEHLTGEAYRQSNLRELERIKSILKAKGYDSIVYENTVEGGGDTYIAFDKSQVQSRVAQASHSTQTEEVADVSERQEVPEEAQAPSGAQSPVEASAGDRAESADAAAGTSAAQAAPAVAKKTALADKDGKPLIVYHGSASKLPTKMRAGEPIYVTTDQGYADSFNPTREGETAAFTADIRSPYYATEQGEIDGIKYSKEAVAKLKEQGYDGAIYKGGKGPQQALVFDATQLTRVKDDASAKPERKVNASVARRQAANARQEEAVAKAAASLAARSAKKAAETAEPQQAAVEQPPAPIQQEAKPKRKPAAKKKAEPVEEAEGVRYSVSGDDYRDEHRAPGRDDGAPLSDLTGEGTIYPDDVYSANGPRYYGTGVKYDADAFRLAKMAKGKPDFDVMIYRAVPKDVDADINPGDWVAITRQYAVDHGESRFDGEYKILTKMVKASEIFTNGDSIQEWGYDPEEGSYSVEGDTDYSLLDLPMLADSLPVLDSFVETLASAGIIKLHANASTLPVKGKVPQGVQALTTADGKIHVVANALNNNAKGVVLHEAFHAGVKSLVGTKVWGDLMQRLNSLYKQGQATNGAANEFWKAARQRVKVAQLKGAVAEGMEAEEFGAYAIEEYANAPLTVKKWVDDLVGAIKAWLLRRFGAQLGKVTPAQLSALAKVALLDVRASRMDMAFSVSGSLSAGAAPAQANAQAQEPTTFAPSEEGILNKIKATLNEFQGVIQDNMNRVKQIQDQIVKQTGVKELRADFYEAWSNVPGRVASRKEDFEKKMLGPMMEKLGKSGYTQDQLTSLLHAMHAKERNEKIRAINPQYQHGSGMTDKRADEILKQYPQADHAKLYEIASEARRIARAALDMKLASGRISQDDYDAIVNAYQFYVPLKGSGEYGPGMQRAMGHDERDEKILENISRDYEQSLIASERNIAYQTLLHLILQYPDDAVWTARVPPKGRRVVPEGGFYVVYKDGMKLGHFKTAVEAERQSELWAAMQQDDILNFEVEASTGEKVQEYVKPLQDHEIMVYVKGDAIRLQINDEKMAQQLRPLFKHRSAGIVRFAATALRTLIRHFSVVYTGKNPYFILKNVVRDIISGSINMTGNHGITVAARAMAKYPQAWAAMFQYAVTDNAPTAFNGTMGAHLREYRAHGGKVGASYMSDLERQGKTLQRLFDDSKGALRYAAEGRVDKAAWIASRKAINALAHSIEVLNQAFENALRLALFATLREDGVKPGKAAQAAKNVTVNFDRRGSATNALGMAYLFINPAIQGTANMTKTLAKGEHKGQAWALVGMMIGGGMYAAMHGMDDDKDRWLGERWADRTKNIRFRIGSQNIVIPMSQEYAPFYAMGVALGEVKRGESPVKAASNVLTSFVDAYYPMQGALQLDGDNPALDFLMAHVPTVVKFPAQVAVNRNVFGSEVVPESDNTKNRPDNLKMNRTTKGTVYDRAAQAIAGEGYANDNSKVSPETLKLAWSTYAGGLGRFIADTGTLAMIAATEPEALEKTDFPFATDFVKPDKLNPVRSRFFDLAEEAKKAADEFAMANKMGDRDAANAMKEDQQRRRLIGLAKMAKAMNEVQGAYADKAVAINADKSLNLADKRARLKKLEAEQESVYRKAIAEFYK